MADVARGPDEIADLVRSAQRGDALAMNALLDRLTPYVGRLCGPIALQDSADAVQQVLISISQNLEDAQRTGSAPRTGAPDRRA